MITRFLIWLKVKIMFRFIPETFSYDFLNGTFTIFGMKYSEDLFREWSEKGIPVNTMFMLMSREDKCLIVKRIMEEKDEKS